MKKAPSSLRVIIALAPLVLALPFAMDIYVPALPHITKVFNVLDTQMQLTLSLFMLTSGIVQFFAGCVADQFSRRRITIFFIILFTLGSSACALSRTIDQLITSRIIQAAGSAGMIMIAFAIVRDIFEGRRSGQVYSYLNGIIAFSPMFAPYIGSYLDLRYGWSATFWALLVISISSLLLYLLLLRETWPKNKRTLMHFGLITEYLNILRHPVFFFYSIQTAFGMCYLYLFCAISPYLIITLLHIPEAQYGNYFAFMGVSVFLGSFVSSAIISRYGLYRSSLVGAALSGSGGLLMFGWHLLTGLTINNFIWPMLFIGIGGTISMGAGSAGLMEPFKERAGMASSLSGALRFLIAAFAGLICFQDTIRSTLPLAIPAIVFSIVGLIVLVLKRQILDFEPAS